MFFSYVPCSWEYLLKVYYIHTSGRLVSLQQTSRLHCKLRFSVFSQKSFLLKIMLLTFFVYYKLGIFTVLFIGTDKNKLHIRQYSKAPITAELTFELIAEIGFVVVKELCADTAWQRISKIDIAFLIFF